MMLHRFFPLWLHLVVTIEEKMAQSHWEPTSKVPSSVPAAMASTVQRSSRLPRTGKT